jgi:hypothetical protein
LQRVVRRLRGPIGAGHARAVARFVPHLVPARSIAASYRDGTGG